MSRRKSQRDRESDPDDGLTTIFQPEDQEEMKRTELFSLPMLQAMSAKGAEEEIPGAAEEVFEPVMPSALQPDPEPVAEPEPPSRAGRRWMPLVWILGVLVGLGLLGAVLGG